jgi:hypothetical protein
MHYKGNCHCGQVAFEAEGEIEGGLACNCSMCARRASLLWFVPRDKFVLTTPESAASSYTFNTHKIEHHFCANCGIHVWGEANDPQGNRIAAVNLRTIEGLDLSKIPVQEFDGRAL